MMVPWAGLVVPINVAILAGPLIRAGTPERSQNLVSHHLLRCALPVSSTHAGTGG